MEKKTRFAELKRLLNESAGRVISASALFTEENGMLRGGKPTGATVKSMLRLSACGYIEPVKKDNRSWYGFSNMNTSYRLLKPIPEDMNTEGLRHEYWVRNGLVLDLSPYHIRSLNV